MRPKTPLAQVYKASGLPMKEFADVLGMKPTTVEKYCYGDLKLPDLSKLEVLQNRFGVDINSLKPRKDGKTGWAMTITGRRLTARYCKVWNKIGEMRPKEISIATKQLSGMIEAVLLCRSGTAPHMTDAERAWVRQAPDRARVIVHKLRSVLGETLTDLVLVEQVRKCFANLEFGEHKPLSHYQEGKDLLQMNDDLPRYNKAWEPWVKKNIPLDAQIKITLIARPTMGLPNLLLTPTHHTKEVEHNWKKYGFGASCTTLMTYKVELAGKAPIYFTDDESEKSEAVISGLYFSDSQFQTPEPAPTKLPAKSRKPVSERVFQPKISHPARPKKAAPKKKPLTKR